MSITLAHRLQIVDPLDVEFDTVAVPAVSSRGTPYFHKARVGMPHLPPRVLNSTFYLYPSADDARHGRNAGGTGFFFGVHVHGDNWAVYAVTNWHVAVKVGASVIRVNCLNGPPDIFELDPTQWQFVPRWHDLAVTQIPLSPDRHDFSFIDAKMAVQKEHLAPGLIGPGEDIFMPGLFVDHDGGETNRPALRFGNISVLPAPIKQETGATSDCYVLDMHSRTGYSGSPVFVYRTLGSNLDQSQGLWLGPSEQFIMLLGVHVGQFPEMWELKAGQISETALTRGANAAFVRGMSGMTVAIPAWSLLEFLNMPQFKQFRDSTAKRLETEALKSPTPIAEAAAAEPESGNPSHKEDFTSLLNAAARKPPQGDQT
jgi:hypothetical protein